MSKLTVQIQKEQSDQGLNCLLFQPVITAPQNQTAPFLEQLFNKEVPFFENF